MTPIFNSGRVTLAIPGEPFAKGRPRFTKTGRTYTDRKTLHHEELLANYFRLAVTAPYPNNVLVHATFYRSTKQRIDVDNLMKAVLDAATGIVWEDDSQVTAITGRLHLDKENPRTEIVFEEDLDSTMPRGAVNDITVECETCGKSFTYRSYKSRPAARFCSQQCARGSGAGDGECVHCGKSYSRRSYGQMYCTPKCSHAARRAQAQVALPDCRVCGTKLQRKGAVLCRECWQKAPNRKKSKRDYLAEDAA